MRTAGQRTFAQWNNELVMLLLLLLLFTHHAQLEATSSLPHSLLSNKIDVYAVNFGISVISNHSCSKFVHMRRMFSNWKMLSLLVQAFTIGVWNALSIFPSNNHKSRHMKWHFSSFISRLFRTGFCRESEKQNRKRKYLHDANINTDDTDNIYNIGCW